MMHDDLIALSIVGFSSVFINLLLVLLNVKLFTEFAKQRMQEARKP